MDNRFENYMQLGRRGEPDRDVPGSPETYDSKVASARETLRGLMDSEKASGASINSIDSGMKDTVIQIEFLEKQIRELSFRRAGIEVSSDGK